MNKTSFTPAPWSWVRGDDNEILRLVSGNDTDRLRPWVLSANGQCSGCYNESWFDYDNKHDLALIESAPDMYAALSALVEQWDTPNWKLEKQTGELIRIARESLKKARGE